MTHPLDLARLRTAEELKQERPLAYGLTKAFVPVLGQAMAAKDYTSDVQNGDTLSAIGNAANFFPGYGASKAAIAEGAAHLIPAYNAAKTLVNDGVQAATKALAPQGLRRAVGINGQILGNDQRLYDAATVGY